MLPRASILLAIGAAFVAWPTQAETITACDVSVDYRLAPLEASTPETLRPFQGVWKGSWDGILCSYLIVEEIKPDGAVRAQYVYGTASAWQIFRPGKTRWTGKINGNKMSFQGPRGWTEYVLQSSGRLSGTYANNNTQSTGTFVKE